jgi:hypothetical protein
MKSIRLDAIPITSLPQMNKADTSFMPSTKRVNCVLHSGQLPAQQRLEVHVNGVLQTGVQEGDQTVFTWQLFKASDEIHIILLNRGIRKQLWQGWWNEQDALFHTGILQMHVFFDGKPQPMVETITAGSPPVTSAQQSSPFVEIATSNNGHRATAVLEPGKDTDDGESAIADDMRNTPCIVQDLLVIAEAKRPQLLPQETEDTLTEGQRVFEAEEFNEIEAEDDENEQEPDFALSEELGTRIDEGNVSAMEGDEYPGGIVSPPRMGRRIATFHASPLNRDEMLEALKNLVDTLSPTTLIVDLRIQTHSQKKKYQEHSGLSKPLLRAVFGGKYWDRGWAIQTSSRFVPSTSSKASEWRYVVSNPDSHPEGIPSLVKHLEEGYSLVMIDSHATYKGSRRRAVVEELQRRVSDLEIGPLS